MIILAIETSCDDTCISIIKVKSQKSKVKTNFEILSNVVSSQVKLHAKYGGVYPFLAKREHQRNLPIVLKKALRKAGFLNSKFKMKNEKLDLIAVTKGPGLEPCLWVGINFAKDLSEKMNIPLVPTNHIESHILANFLNTKYQIPRRRNSVSLRGRLNTKYLFPAVCLVVSGGHTQLILMRDFGKYQILGETRDDAAGECFDKVARILGLGYPGGPAIAAEAARYKIQDTRYKAFLPRPMMYQKNYDFSFSGLKTAVLYDFQSRSQKIRKSKEYIQVMAKEVQQTIIDVLIHKTLKAAKNLKAESIILGGGVTANDELRKQLRSKVKSQMPNVKLFVPPRSLCTDNAVMAAVTAYYRWLKRAGENWHNIEADANLRLE